MSVRYSSDIDGVSWTELADVIEKAPLGTRDPAQVERAFRNSAVRVFAYDGDRLIGGGRAISDGVWRAAIYDVVVLPEYQGRGIGAAIMRRIVEAAGVDVIMLYAVPGKERFYDKLGFRKMKTAMALMGEPERRRAMGYIE